MTGVAFIHENELQVEQVGDKKKGDIDLKLLFREKAASNHSPACPLTTKVFGSGTRSRRK